MNKIVKFDKPTCRKLGTELEALVKTWAAERGLKVAYAGGTLDDLAFSAKLKFSVDDPAAVAKKERENFERYCGMFNLEAKHYAAVVTIGGRRMQLVGMEMGRSKFPLKFKDINGKVVLYTDAVCALVREACK